jgi:uncharacterized protein (TIGR02594 family)
MYNLKLIQKKLKELNYYTDTVDGIYGPNTKQAVMNFQRDNKIRVDGIIGPSTWEKLFKYKTPPKVVTDKDPPWVKEMLSYRGLHEVKNKEALIQWLRSDGTSVGDPSKIPWCGDAVETAIKKSLLNEVFTGNLKKNPYWARNWLEFGENTKPVVGAILVFGRGSGGHVGFYMGETKTHFLVLGGNQTNSITISKIAKNRLLGARWPKTFPKTNKVIISSGKGLSETVNEQ